MEFTTRLELHSQTTRLFEGALHGAAARPDTGLSPSAASRPRGLGAGALPKHPLQITTRTPEGPDFKSELLPLHSPLLGQSLLVSFPPLIDMLKFSEVGGQAVLGRQDASPTPWLTERHGYDPTCQSILYRLQLGPQRGQISNLSFCLFTRRY